MLQMWLKCLYHVNVKWIGSQVSTQPTNPRISSFDNLCLCHLLSRLIWIPIFFLIRANLLFFLSSFLCYAFLFWSFLFFFYIRYCCYIQLVKNHQPKMAVFNLCSYSTTNQTSECISITQTSLSLPKSLYYQRIYNIRYILMKF